MKCHYCEKTHDLRPYGPKGAMVCFSCAMGTPERKTEAERNFAAQLDAAGSVALIDGTEVGPYPAEHNPDAMRLMRHNAELWGRRSAASSGPTRTPGSTPGTTTPEGAN